MPNPSPPCKTGRAGVWPIGACSGRNWGLRMRPQSPPGALNTEMWLGAKLFFSSRFTRGARYGKWAAAPHGPFFTVVRAVGGVPSRDGMAESEHAMLHEYDKYNYLKDLLPAHACACAMNAPHSP